MADYLLDWDDTGADGSATFSSSTGGDDIAVTVSTPTNWNGDNFSLNGGVLSSSSVCNETKILVDFDSAVENVSFEIYDVDAGSGWDDKVTIIARDAEGNIVPVNFSDLIWHHQVNGNSVEGGGNSNPGVEGSGAPDSVTVTIAGPIVSIEIIHDDGDSSNTSGTVRISDMEFDAAAPELDGVVEGTSGNDTIDVAYAGDPEGDMIDNNDEILPGEAAQDDIVVAGAGDDLVLAADGDDTIFGEEGDDTLCGMDGDDTIHGGSGNDVLEGMNGNDTLYGGSGEDAIYGDAGNDVAYGGGGSDTIYGGTGDDVLHGGSGNGAGEEDVLLDFNGLSTGETLNTQFTADGVTISSADPGHPVMVFDTNNPTGGDWDLSTANLGNVLILSEDGDASDPDDNASGGTFVFDFHTDSTVSSITLLDIEEAGGEIRLYDGEGNLLNTVSIPTTANNGQSVVSLDTENVARMEVSITGSGAIDNVSYTMNADGEADEADTISGGAGDDEIYGEEGDDTLSGGAGNDYIEGNDGDDTIDGGTGDDVIYGDNHGAGGGGSIRESFEWDLAPDPDSSGAIDDGDNLEGGFTQNTGNVDVTFTVVNNGAGTDTEFADNNQMVAGIDTDGGSADDNSSLSSTTNGTSNSVDYQLEFSDAVDDVSFRINDVDGDGVVRVLAYDAAGNQIEVDLTAGSHVTLLDTDGVAGNDTADSNGGYEADTSSNYSVLVSIPGPVARIVIEHSQDGGNNSGINITDVFFDAPIAGTGEGGDDIITGGEGDDSIFGEGGDDTITGGAGSDTISGGAGNDTIIGGNAGDVVDGGTEGPDYDTLDLSDEGPLRVINQTVDADGDSTSGTIEFLDSDGNVTGTMTFAEIENLILPPNTGPTANDDAYTLDEDDSITFNPLLNDTDPDGDTLTLDGASDPAHGTITDNGDGTYTYTPDADFNGTDSVTYTIDDGNGGTDTATVTFTVNPINDDPVANDDTASTDEDTPVTIDVLANDTDVDGDTLEVVGTPTADHGTVTVNPDGTLEYTPDADYNGPDTITYVVGDGNGGTDTGSVAVTVGEVNDGPVANDDSASTDEDTPVTIDVLGNDTDVDGDPLEIVGTPTAEHGTVTVNPDGTLEYTPDADYNGPDTITYVVGDGQGGTDTGSVDVTVDPVNDAPDAVNDTATTDEDTPVTIDVLANDTDVDGDPLTITGATVPADQGTVEIVGGELLFTPAENFNGTATISYSIEDGQGGTDTATVEVTVTPVNDDPIAVDDVADTDEDTPVTIDLIGNDVDVDGDPLTIGTVSVPASEGTVVDNGDGTVTFTPAPNYFGPATITYTVVDGQGGSDTGEALVNVGSVNDGPDAVDDADTTDEDTPITVDLLANDTDPDGDALTVTGATVPADQGTLVDNGDGTVTFTPAPDFNGTATITYSVTDGNGGTDTAEHVITVTPVNDDPVAVDDIETTDEDQPITIDLIGNDTDVDGDPLTIGTVSVPADQGTVVDNGDGTVTFTPALNFNGPATITYTVVDGQGGEDTGEAVVSVGAVNDAPIANDDSDTTDEDTPVTVNLIGNDTDPDGDTLTVINATVPADQGTLVDNGDGTVTFTPAPDFTGDATISYEVSDGNGGTDTAVHVITVAPVNDGPVANDDSASTDEDTPVTIDVLGNDTDADGDTLTVVGTPTALHGTVTVNPDGTLEYTPDADYNGDDTITYEISDGNGGTDTAEVAVTVAPVNDDPVANDDTASTDEDTPVTIDVLANDTDVDGDPLEIIGTPTADHGTVTVNPDGTLEYTPDADYNGPDTITYVVGDGQGGTNTGSVDVTVGSVNDGPDAVDDTASTDEDTPVTIDVLGNDTDADGDTLEVVGTPTALHGTVTVNPDGTLEYTPDADYNGDDTITYEISDGNGGTDTAEVAVTVAPVNDDPVANDDGDVTDFETPVTIDVLGNDTDVDGDTLEVLGTPTSDDGTVVVNADGTITFTPNDGFEGDAIINYEITDGNGGTDTAVVTVTVSDDPRDGIVSGTDGDDLIDYDYTGDPDGDLVDHNDEIIPGEGPNDDIIEAGGGNDTIFAGEGDDTVHGGTGDDTIDGGAGDDYLSGGEGDDIIYGGDGDDTLDAGQGSDQLYGGAGDDLLLGGPGTDLIDGGTGDDTIIGGNSDDTIIGGDGSDTVYGNDGNDVIDTSGSDPQPDLAYPSLYPADTDPDDDKDTVYGGAGNDTITTGDDADIIFGGTGNDTIDGGIDADTIDGGDGNDTIIGGEGSDIIDGGAGDDVIYAGLDPSFPDALNIPDDGSGPFGPDLVPNNGMDLVHGGDGNDTIYGADDDDTLFGDAGDDYIDGGIDDDTIDGGTGNDTLLGGQGDDTITGGAGNDSIDGGIGADIMSGGDDQDTFSNINAGDVVDGNEGGVDFDTLDLTGSRPVDGTIRVIYDAGNPENGHVDFRDEDGNVIGTMEFTNIENVIPCFTPGSMIATPKGERLVEELREGDKVITRDNGIQEIRWVGEKKLDWKALAANPHLKPILIRKGSLGNDLPERDMMVSPNHRMLVANDKTSLYFEEREVLAAAKHLVNNQGVHAVDTMGISYLHFMFDNHEVVLSDGAWTESFQPGDYTLQGIGNAQRSEILELFPELATAEGIENYQSARRTLKAHEARLLAK